MMMMMMKLLMVWGMPLARLKSCSIHDARLVNLLQTAGQVSKRMEKLMWRRARESHGSWTDEPEIIGQWLMGDGLVMDILKLSKSEVKTKASNFLSRWIYCVILLQKPSHPLLWYPSFMVFAAAAVIWRSQRVGLQLLNATFVSACAAHPTWFR